MTREQDTQPHRKYDSMIVPYHEGTNLTLDLTQPNLNTRKNYQFDSSNR